MYNPYSLENRKILITGASSGIGRATAIECSKLGATLLLSGRNEERLNDTLDNLDGFGHQIILGDLTDNDTIETIVSSIEFVDGVVLCAGKGLTAPFKFCTRERYEDLFSTNFFSPIELLRLLVRKKKIVNSSSIVFVCSIAGVANYKIGGGIYGASKAALAAVMKYCAYELASKQIRVNSVHPAMVQTPILSVANMSEEEYKTDMEKYPLKRYGQPEDVAYAIIYLLSNASSWVTGHAMIIDGGRTLL